MPVQTEGTVRVPLPDPGALVEVRARQWVVRDVRPCSLPHDPVGAAPRERHNLVTLASVEEDALGEETTLVWEVEPGASVRESFELPDVDGFDQPDRLDAFLDAVRWGAVSQADLRALQAPFRSGIEIEDYQLDPVVRALSMPRVNLLVADDVGLGKTIEAGLVVQELALRGRVRTVLVVCPASLQIQWRDQMRDKFGLEFRIVDSELMKTLRRTRGLHVNPWTHFPRLITSIDYLKRERPLRLFREVVPPEGTPIQGTRSAPGVARWPRKFDLLIVDEAHNIAPAGSAHYAVDSQRTRAIRFLSPHFEHRLFLSATPHNGYRESFTSLLELLDNQRFARGVEPDRAQLERVMVRRMKYELPPRWDGSPRFPARELAPLEVPWTEADREAHRTLQAFADLRRQNPEAAADPGELATQGYAAEFVLKLLKKRLFSSPAAFRNTLERHREALDRAGQRPARTVLKPTEGLLRRRVAGLDEDFGDDNAYQETLDEVVRETSGVMRPLTGPERDLLEKLLRYAETSERRGDAKLGCLLEFVEATVRPGGRWGDTRLIVFTEYRDTQKWLQEKLAARNLADHGLLEVIYGGMPTEEREAVKAAFQADPAESPVRILLATDAASEGIDLQNHCSRMVHYEIPWNPNRLEQRNGRVDRHGQKDDRVRIHHFVGQGYRSRAGASTPGDLEGDLEFLMRVALKVENIREDLGKVGPVLAAQVEEAMLGRRVGLDTAHAEKQAGKDRRYLKFERDLREQCARLKEQLDESRRELRLAPDNVRQVVQIGLDLAGQPPLEPASVPGLWPDPNRVAPPVWRVPALSGSWARCTEGLPHPHTGRTRPLVFDDALAVGRDDVVLCHLNHRLVQMCLRLLRAEIWARQGRRLLHRVTARLVPRGRLEQPVVVAHGRLVVLGRQGHCLHEELVEAGCEIRQGRARRLNVGETREALMAATDLPAPAEMGRRLQELWPNLEEAVVDALKARTKDRTRNLGSRLEERRDREISDMKTILQELERRIHEGMEEPPKEQLLLWSTEEQEQLRRNVDGLRARLKEIPDEIRREEAAIRDRYAEPSDRLFPVALTFLVPEGLR